MIRRQPCVEHLGHVDAPMVERKPPWCPFASMAGVTLNLDFESGSRRIHHHRSAVQQPQDQREDDADDQQRYDREVKAEVFALDDDVPGQATKADFVQQGPEQTGGDQHHTENDQPADREMLAA